MLNLKKEDFLRPDGYVNATKLCQSAGKLWSDYLRLKSTEVYLNALSIALENSRAELVITKEGGVPTEQGTWVHPEVAVDLARWISVEYRIQVNRWMVELHTTGTVSIAPPSEPKRLRPARDTIDFVNAAKDLESLSFSPTLKRLLVDSLIDDLELQRNEARRSLPGMESKTRYTIARVRARELGYADSQIGDGSALGKWVAARVTPAFSDTVGKFVVKHYEVCPALDAAIESFFLHQAAKEV